MEHIGCVVESTVLQRITVLHVISYICNYEVLLQDMTENK